MGQTPGRMAAGLTILAASLGAANCRGPAPEPRMPVACAALLDVELDGTTITSATLESGPFLAPGSRRPLPTPPFCRVTATVAPAVQYEVWLPEAGWNGKFQGVGNGGMAGSISYPALADAVALGYAAASTDTGHPTTQGPFDASWAAGRPDLTDDFGFRATHLTAVYGKAITDARYGTPAAQSYFVGCSKGGQQGLMEAQRYPEDYDGLIAGDPAHDWIDLYAGEHLWISQATLADPESYLPPGKLRALDDAVMAACDTQDGLEDGVLADPRTCDFDPAALTCGPDQDDASCLTPKQVEAVRKIWTGARDSHGSVVFPGLLPGGESESFGWNAWVTGGGPFTGLHWQAADSFFRHMVFNDPAWDFRTFDLDTDVDTARDRVGAALDAVDPDLGPLRDRGAKLIVYHGWSDADISPLSSIEYYEDVVSTVGTGLSREDAVTRTQEFFRLFMVPGMNHCRGGRGTDQFDMLRALEEWVEEDVSPDRVEAARVRNGAVDRTRPLCPYPQAARWDGVGDPDESASFSCVASLSSP